ncbi:MAG TPA: ABC transporter ATP-binding protein [Dehalococcoidia bacterium]|nr:ABC transporter ATP-binding protein [Dehalococcoidia bacterium]
MEYAIKTENLVKKYGKNFTALDNVSIEVGKGDVVGYVGPNGAGKTTTIKILSKLIRSTSGHAYIDGVDVNKAPREAFYKVGALIEVPGIYDYLTPHEMLTYFGKVYRMGNDQIDRRIKETLELVELSAWEHKKIGAFSTGMLRRLVLTKAIFHEPEIVLLDEPVLGLDPAGIVEVRELIKRFHSGGMTIFLSSHLLGEVAEVCNRVIFLNKGRVIASDSIKNIESNMKYSVINVRFLEPLSDERLEALKSVQLINGVELEDNIARIQFDGELETSSRILRQLVSLDYEIVSYSLESMDLEDYYISIMNENKGAD